MEQLPPYNPETDTAEIIAQRRIEKQKAATLIARAELASSLSRADYVDPSQTEKKYKYNVSLDKDNQSSSVLDLTIERESEEVQTLPSEESEFTSTKDEGDVVEQSQEVIPDISDNFFISDEELQDIIDSVEFSPKKLASEKDLTTPSDIKRYREKTSDFLILTQENIEAIGNYIESRIAFYEAQGIKDVRIVEVGAGNGRLSHFLNEKFKKDFSFNEIIPTDDFSWETTENEDIPLHFPVTYYGVTEALEQFSPTIVVCSMMTPNGDLSSEFRRMPTVQEYILLGHRLGTGNEWDTHGENFAGSLQDMKDTLRILGEDQSPPFEIDGFERTEIDRVSDTLVNWAQYDSVTVPKNDTGKMIMRGIVMRCDSFRRS